ncbi:DUF6301 family protein [Nocardia terpenica]|uniref:Uncharacterized protein n=2 Tax=Nocardia terpenica TaxID=455432 RepID=A0A809QUZ4_9NOCA|nr:DUF6301 family protein [Nocardia terpenica]NQE85867.1 hypothetical protein [Nocardia terpenica]BBE00888.1 hypothetical protein [Nocardia terpenica]
MTTGTIAKRQLPLVLHGRLDEGQLENLCANLGLTASGSTDESIGTELGRYTCQHPRFRTLTDVILTLVRSGPAEWTLAVDVAPGSDIDSWLRWVETGVRAAGLAIDSRVLPPSSPERTEAQRRADLEEATYVIEQTHRALGIRRSSESTASITDRSTGAPAESIIRLPAIDIRRKIRPDPIRPPRESTGWRALDDHQVVELAVRLRSLVWSWRMDDMLRLSAVIPWHWEPAELGSTMSDSQPSTADGYVYGDGAEASCIELAVTTPGTDPAQLLAAFTRMADVLTETLGEPNTRVSEALPQACWASEKNTLVLAVRRRTVALLLERHDSEHGSRSKLP